MDDDARAALSDAVIRELVALSALALLLWASGPGRTVIPAAWRRVRLLISPADPFEGQVREFSATVSRWEHEQAAQSHRRPAVGGPRGCGCGGAPGGN